MSALKSLLTVFFIENYQKMTKMNSSQKELYNRFKAAVTTDSVTNELACDTLNLLDNLIQRSQDSDKKHLKAQAQLTDMAIIIHQLRDISVRINDSPKS